MISRAIVALHAVITSAEALIVQRSRVGIHNASFPDTGPGVSIMFPGFGEPDRIHLMKKHVQWLRRQTESFDCTIYVYKSEKDFPLDSADFAPCTIARHVGGQFMDHFKAFKPSKPLVLTWIDSVDIDPRASLTRMIRVAEANELEHLGVGDICWAGNSSTLTRNADQETFKFSPNQSMGIRCKKDGLVKDVALNGQAEQKGIIYGDTIMAVNDEAWDEIDRERQKKIMNEGYAAEYEATFKVSDGVGREYYAVDFEFDLFHADAFQCLQSIIDVDINPFGWGVDVVFPWACKVKQGLWDEVAWSHASHKSYDYESATKAKKKYWAKFKKLGWTHDKDNRRHAIRQLVDPDKPKRQQHRSQGGGVPRRA